MALQLDRTSLTRLGIALVLTVSLGACQQLQEWDRKNLDGKGAALLQTSVVYGGAIAGQLSAYLQRRDQQNAEEAFEESVQTGENRTWSNKETGVSGQTTVQASSRQQRVSVPVLKNRVKEVPPLDLIGEPYEAIEAVNVRGGPSTDYVVDDKLATGEVVVVAGKVQQKDWYMISQNGAGSGFVHAEFLRPASKDSAVTAKAAPAGEVVEASIETKRKCRTVTQTITLEDGSKRQEEITACKGPNGWETVES